MAVLPISVMVLAKNEEKRLKDCLDTVKGWADEIVIVDDNSTDKTREIAAQYTDKILTRTMDQEGRHRNWAAAQGKHDWVLILDCDERMSDELKAEIAALFPRTDDKVVAYWAGQINYLGDDKLLHGGWSNPHFRLYNRKHVTWSEKDFDVVHPGIKVAEGYKGANLKGVTIHYSFRNIEDMIAKINRYSTLEALKWYGDKRKMTRNKAMWRAFDRFWRRFVGKKGYKDGYPGFAAAVISGFHEFAAYSKYKEIKEKGLYVNRITKSS